MLSLSAVSIISCSSPLPRITSLVLGNSFKTDGIANNRFLAPFTQESLPTNRSMLQSFGTPYFLESLQCPLDHILPYRNVRGLRRSKPRLFLMTPNRALLDLVA